MPSNQKKISSFGIIKGPMIPESYACFRAWDWEHTKAQNFQKLRSENLVEAPTTAWLRDVSKALSSRFDPNGKDKPLTLLAQKDPGLESWKHLLLWHWAQDEYLLRMFLLDWLGPRLREGYVRFKPEDLLPALKKLWDKGGPVAEPWSEATTKRVATGLLKAAAIFGLMEGGTVKTLAPYHLPEPCFMYVLRALLDREGSPRKAVEAPDWGIFLMDSQAVKQELLRLHQYRKLEYHAAGSLVELTLPHANLLDLVNGWS
ncbi:MAG: BrxA family protein [Candidatus Micrarchaeota archaeon]